MSHNGSRWLKLCIIGALGALPARALAQDLRAEILGTSVNYGAGGSNTVTVTARVCNGSSVASAPSSTLGIYFNTWTAPGCSDTPAQTATIGALAPGACSSTLAFSLGGVAPGDYTNWARADWNCAVVEENEANNNVSAYYRVRPNLQVQNFTTTVSGTTVTHSFRVRNLGSAITSSVGVGLYFDAASAPACGAAADQSWTISSLAPQATQDFTITRTGVAAGQYTARAFADSGCALTESDEGDNQASSAYGVGPNIWVSPDVIVSVNGSTVNYTVSVCNLGSTSTGSFKTALWYNMATGPTCSMSTAPDHTWTVGSLGTTPATSCTTLTHTRTNAVGGGYLAWVYADSDCAVTEANEGDNVRSKSYAVPRADFYVQSFTSTVSGTDVTYDVTVCNQGSDTTLSFLVGLYYSGSSAPVCGLTPDHTWAVSGLSNGGCTTLSWVRNAAPQGSYTAWILADSGCAVSEADEANNTDFSAYGIAPSQPDLFVASINAVVVGSQVTYTTMVCNAGTAVSSDFSVGLLFNGSSVPGCVTTFDHADTVTGGLGQGACRTLTHVRTGATSGSYQAWAMVDRGCAVTEFSEVNNTASDYYTVLPPTNPDLVVRNLTATVTGSTVTYSAQVCNEGTALSPASQVGLWYSRTTAPSTTCLDTPDVTASVGQLFVQGCETKTWTQVTVPPGTYTAHALADSQCGVSESTETNNSRSAAYTVSAPPTPDARVADARVADARPADARPADARIVDAVQPDARKADAGSDARKADAGKPDARAVDAGPGAEAGPTSDAGVTDGPPPAGDVAPTDSGGCGCEVADTGSASTFGLVLGLFFLFGRRRRRS
ncbi:MAG: hypothetical protein IT371_03215 [Deltaproteobacteria bacterium]|nr:hypothetical protein [Deltaproteobacteria bacterium]